jgi:hypothetical protein
MYLIKFPNLDQIILDEFGASLLTFIQKWYSVVKHE